MGITIKEIAAIVGVSRGTVDRALHGRGRIKPEIIAQVLDVAKKAGYKPSRAAKQLVIQKQNLKLGIITRRSMNVHGFWANLSNGAATIEKELAEYKVSVLKRYFDYSHPEQQAALIDELLAEGISGLIIAPMDHEAVRKKLHTLRKTETAGSRSVPVVFIASEIHGFEPLCYIGGDEYKEGRTAAGLLQFAAPSVFSTEQQRLNVLILKVSDYVLGHQLRIDGFINELENAATPYAVREIVNITSDADYAYAKTIELLSMYPDIGAIITVSGNAVSVSKAIASLGLKNNLIHICFDQGLLHQLEHIDNSRTAVISQDAYRQGYLSLQILFDYVACEIEPENRRILTHNEIFIKQNQAGDTGF